MPKLKTRKAIAKRVKITARGKILVMPPGKRHLLSTKSSKKKRKLGKYIRLTGILAKKFRKELVVYKR